MSNSNKRKKKKWLRPHHVWIRNIAMPIMYVISRFLYGIKYERFSDWKKRPHLILYNHQTAFDQFFVGMVYPGAVYYVASEDLFSNGLVSKIIKFAVNPIPIKKSTSDMRAVLNCMQVAKEGGTIAIAPEGNRTFSGETGYIKPSIVSLVRALKMPVALLRLEGGYGVHPRWSDVKRRGEMRAYISKVIEKETYNSLSDGDLLAIIEAELYVDDTASRNEFQHNRKAEYLERAIYYCPVCGISEFESNKDTLKCKKCGLSVTYRPDLTLISDNQAFTYSTTKDWYRAQSDYINSIDPQKFGDSTVCADDVVLYEVIPYKRKIRLGRCRISLTGSKISFSGEYKLDLCFDEVTAAAVLGRNKLNVYVRDKIYQVKSHKRFNAVKYMNMYYRCTNVKKGDLYGEFLGI